MTYSRVTLKNGQEKYRLLFTDELTGKRKELSVTMPCHSVRNEKKAQDILKDRYNRLYASNSGEMTLSEVSAVYIEKMAETWRESTKIRNERNMDMISRYFPPETVLVKLEPRHFRNALEDITSTPTGYNEYNRRLKAFLRWCVANDYLDTDITPKLANKPSDRDDKATDKYLESEQMVRLLEAMEHHTLWHNLTRFMLLSGLRCGEALALLQSDVDRYIHVNKTYSAITHKVGAPKTKCSIRDVSVTKELREVLNDINEYNKFLSNVHGIKTDLLFFREDGSRVDYNAYNKFLRELSERVLGFPITTHWLRHTHASMLLANGIPIDTISRRLGHDTTEITQRVYLHVINKLKERDAERLDDIRLL